MILVNYLYLLLQISRFLCLMSGSILPIKMVTLTKLSLLFPTTIVPKSTVFHRVSQWVHEVRHLHLFTCERDARFTYTCSIWIAMGGFLRLRADCTRWQRWCSQIATIKTAYVIKWTATHWQQHYKIQHWPTISLNINNGKSPEKKHIIWYLYGTGKAI